MERDGLLGVVADAILAVADGRGRATRVAIDGIDAAGKTTLADEVAGVLEDQGQRVIRASIDGFHNPRVVRYARGPLSPEGYYLDSFDLEALVTSLLAPLGPDGDGRYQTAIYDHQSDRPLKLTPRQAPVGTILLFDGIFLGRPELLPHWDLFIFIDISFEVCLARARQRDVPGLGTAAEVRRRYQTRYIPGQQIYLDSCQPRQQADLIIHNDDPTKPQLAGGW